jgi:putative sterol carrier protein
MKRRSILLALVLTMFCSSVSLRADDSSTPQQVFDGMKQSFRADKAKGVHAKYQWELSGPNGGDWWIEVNDGAYKMGRGNDWVAMSNGKLKGTWAYMTGRLKVHGPQSVARKLDEIFP